uniref:Transposase n=1 Tax=Steinernema glaseri TaxID=37863 RepID=A0A1I8AEM7_9BILA
MHQKNPESDASTVVTIDIDTTVTHWDLTDDWITFVKFQEGDASRALVIKLLYAPRYTEILIKLISALKNTSGDRKCTTMAL